MSAEVPYTPYAIAAGDDGHASLTFVSMSKAFNFAGLLCGAAVVGERTRERWFALARRLHSGTGTPGIIATQAALSPEGERWLDSLHEVLAANRRRVLDALPQVLPGVHGRDPDATYLLWIDCSATSVADDPAAAFLERGVRVSPGEEFGRVYETWIRLNIGTSPAIVDLMLQRLESLRTAPA